MVVVAMVLALMPFPCLCACLLLLQDMFCNTLNVLPTGQYHKLFNMYDRVGQGYIDMKEFILGLFNYVNMEKDEKVKLIFQLFDEDRSGFLSENELEQIIMATHMQGADSVKSKLGMLMKQVRIMEWISSSSFYGYCCCCCYYYG